MPSCRLSWRSCAPDPAGKIRSLRRLPEETGKRSAEHHRFLAAYRRRDSPGRPRWRRSRTVLRFLRWQVLSRWPALPRPEAGGWWTLPLRRLLQLPGKRPCHLRLQVLSGHTFSGWTVLWYRHRGYQPCSPLLLSGLPEMRLPWIYQHRPCRWQRQWHVWSKNRHSDQYENPVCPVLLCLDILRSFLWNSSNCCILLPCFFPLFLFFLLIWQSGRSPYSAPESLLCPHARLHRRCNVQCDPPG